MGDARLGVDEDSRRPEQRAELTASARYERGDAHGLWATAGSLALAVFGRSAWYPSCRVLGLRLLTRYVRCKLAGKGWRDAGTESGGDSLCVQA